MLVDSHSHIHTILGKDSDHTAQKWHKSGIKNPDDVISDAKSEGVERFVCVGTDLADSELAVEFVADKEDCRASVGVHPHEAKDFLDKHSIDDIGKLAEHPGVVAIGECGLDYYYENSPRDAQIKLFEQHLDLATKKNLPVIFHVRDAFDDFWPVVDNFPKLRGVVHSFSSTTKNMDAALSRGFYVGLNGIMTFTKDEDQLKAARTLPLEKMLLETDSPYLTPKPFRGKICTPKHIKLICEFMGELRGESFDQIAEQTTRNTFKLLKID